MNKKALSGALILLCVGFLVWFWVLRVPRKERPRLELAEALAAAVAKEAAAAVPGGGALVILAPPEDPGGDRFPEKLAQKVRQEAEAAGLKPAQIVRLPPNPLIEADGEPVRKEDFVAALREHASAACVVSLLGIPRLTPADLPQPRPKLIVATTAMMPYAGELPASVMDVLIVPKTSPNDTSTDPVLGDLSRYFRIARFPAVR